MSTTTAVRNAFLVARLQIHRAWRRALERPHVLLAQVGFLVAMWVYFVVFAPSGGEMPTATTEGFDSESIREATRGMVAVLWLFHVGIATIGTPSTADAIPGGAFLLRSAGVRSTLWGTMLAEYARRLLLFGVFALATAVAVLWEVGLPTRNLLLMVTVLLLFLSAELVGMALKLGIAATGLRPSRGTLVVFGGILLSGGSLAIGHPSVLLSLLAKTPLGDFGEVFLSNVPAVEANRTAALRIVAGSLIAIPFLVVFVERTAKRVWFTGDQRGEAGAERTRVDEWLGAAGIQGPTHAIAWRLWLQSRRDPLVLGLMAVPFLLSGLILVDPEGTSVPLFPLFVGLYAIWMTGVVLTLNPFSSETGTLPHLLSASGHEVVGGYALTATMVGLPVTVSAVVLGGFVGGPGSLVVPATVVSVAVFTGAIPAGIAIGLLLPRVEALSTQMDGPITPSKFAIAGFSLVFLTLATPAYLGLYLADGWHWSPLVLAGIALTIGLSATVAVTSYRYAGRRLDRLTLA